MVIGRDNSKLSDNTQSFSKNFFKKPQGCSLCLDKKQEIDFKNLSVLSKFISEGGRILPSRITNVCIKHQRKLTKSIKRARMLSLLPFVSSVNNRSS